MGGRGFTLVELTVVMGIVILLGAISSVGVLPTVRRSQVDSSRERLIADIKAQQMRAMAGEMSQGTAVTHWGVKLEPAGYVLFAGGSYLEGASENVTVTWEGGWTGSNTFPQSEIKFEVPSGEVAGMGAEVSALVVQDGSGEIIRLELNRYGKITSN